MLNVSSDFSFGSKNLVIACHITGIFDVNRSNTLPADDFSLVKEWAESLARLNVSGIIFHNNFSEETCRVHQNKHLKFVWIEHDAAYNPNVYRYWVYQEFLKNFAQNIDNLFITDVSDVVIVTNPFDEPLFLNNPNSLFCGDEPKILDNPWMVEHGSHLRNKIAEFSQYEAEYSQATLLNCGIIGGNIDVMKPFLEQLWGVHQRFNQDNKTAYTGDMGAFNYLVRTQFNANLFHGEPINTVFKEYQNERTDCWFRHK